MCQRIACMKHWAKSSRKQIVLTSNIVMSSNHYGNHCVVMWCMLYMLSTKVNVKVIIYEIVDEAHPQSGFFFPHMLILLRKCISNHETKQASKFQRDPSPNCFTIDAWNINCWYQQFISYFLIVFLYRILRHFTQVL